MSAAQILSQVILSLLRWLVTVAVAIGVLSILGLVLFNTAFPEQRTADFRHLVIPETLPDCYLCHAKMTPKIAHDWYESAHGPEAVECADCHGYPDRGGAMPFTAHPDQRSLCRECHDSAAQHAEAKFGIDLACSVCHPFHQNSLHQAAYRGSAPERVIE
jgi:predicted CXXCH cytochrome family protein